MADEFDDMSDVNPFNDPAVIAASKRADQVKFENRYTTSQISGNPNARPDSPTGEFYNSGAGGVGITEELQRFKQREEDIMRREQELKRREEDFEKNRQNGYRPKNFPPFPKWIPLEPCFYVNIDEEVPIEHRVFCTRLLYRYYGYCGALVLNVILNLFGLFAGLSGSIGAFISSIIFMIVIIPLSFVFVFRSGYIALKKKSSFYFFLFFASLFCECSFHFFQSLGINGNSWAGFLNGGHLIDSHYNFVGSLFVLNGFLFGALFVYSIYAFKMMYDIYKSCGANFQDAQSEFATKVFFTAGSQAAKSQTTPTNLP